MRAGMPCCAAPAHAPLARPWPAQQVRGPRRPAAASAAASCATQQPCTCGIVIVDHGSRRAASNEMLLQFCALYQQLTQQPIVEPAHMEIAEPSIAQAVGRCVAAGARRVVVAPYFLSRGRHIQEDIPALVAEAAAQHPGVTCTIADPIGIDPLMVQLIHSRVQAVMLRQDSCAAAADAPPAAAAVAPEGVAVGASAGAALRPCS